MNITTYAEALAGGLKFYFTGYPCSRGHVCQRRLASRSCLECEKYWAGKLSEKKAAARATKKARAAALPAPGPVMRPLTPRAAAKIGGSTYYVTGKPCSRGHISERKTCCGGCVACIKENRSKESAVLRARARAKEHYQEIRDEKLAYGKRYRDENRARFTRWMAEWRENNRDRDRANKRAAQARRRANSTGATPLEMSAWIRVQKKVCHWCGVMCPQLYHVDHYVPLSKGGEHEVHNLVIACRKCNLKKSAKDPYDFAATVGRLF